MGILDLTAVSAVTKVQYTQSKVYNLCYEESKVFAKIKKKNNFYGSTKHVAFRYGSPQARGGNFTAAIANMSTSSYAAVDVPRKKDYCFVQLDGETIAAASNDAGALLNVVKTEFDAGFFTASQNIAFMLFANGGGARGQVASISTNTFTLVDINQIVNFEKNQVLNFSTTDGTSGSKLAGTVTVSGVNRGTGVVTCTGNITSGIASAAANNYVFQNGDFESAKSMPTGIPGWIPKTDPTSGDNFFGLDRSTGDVTRLSGNRITKFSGGPLEETLIQASAFVKREGGRPDLVAMNPLDIANLVTALGSKVVYDRATAIDNPDFGFKAVTLMGAAGPMIVVPENEVMTGDAWMLDTATWSFETAGGGPKILDEDGNTMRADATTDSYIARIGYYGNFICEAPGKNAYVKL